MLKNPLQEKRNELLSKSMIQSLEKRNFEAYYCETADKAIEQVLSLMPAESTVSWGGSTSIRDMGLTKAIHSLSYNVIDRDRGQNPNEVYELHRQALMSDYYITSTNAITEDGILVNIDGNGNRVAAISFGPKNVIVVCGMNKVAQNLENAISRARFTAAPLNSMRFMGKTPCAVTGKCQNCTSDDSICAQFLITRISRPAKRIKVILVGEELGF